ncbi:MAG: PD-(D/E)XK nuclease family protein [Candidatus Doudnabacteria bacterium]
MPYRGKYDKDSLDSYKMSRSGIEGFVRCPRCFYLDRKLNIGPSGCAPYTLNNAVDYLLKQEFDAHRAKGSKHPLLKKYGIDAVPFPHEKMNEWRENFKGVQFHHKKTNLYVTGAVDDVWVKPNGELIVADYKATSKNDEVTLDADWQMSYKRQMEVYQWLLRMNGFKVSNTGYFVYCNGKKDRKAFDGRLDFEITVLPYKGSDKWIEKALMDIKKLLHSDKLPKYTADCEDCEYQKDILALAKANS